MKKIIILLLLAVGAYALYQYEPSIFVDPNLALVVDENDTNKETPALDSEEALRDRTPEKYACVGEYCDGSMESDEAHEKFTVLQIPLVKNGGDIGCDAGIFYAPHAVVKTQTPLDESYKLLFDIKEKPEIEGDGFRNPVAMYVKLHYDRVALEDGTARVYLKGSLMGPGHCSFPELRAQITETALWFESVREVKVYLNNKLYDWCEQDMSDGEGTCPEEPDYWTESRD